jgi:hypothetical protein
MHQRIHRLRRRLQNIDQPLMRPHLKMLTTLLIHVRRPVYTKPIDLRRQRHRPTHKRPRPLRRINNPLSRLIKHLMIVSLESNPNLLLRQVAFSLKRGRGREPSEETSMERRELRCVPGRLRRCEAMDGESAGAAEAKSAHEVRTSRPRRTMQLPPFHAAAYS